MGTLKGSPLNNGRTWTWRDCHGSPDDPDVMPGMVGVTIVWADVACDVFESEGASAGKCECARLPRRCISRVTSFESYVRAEEVLVGEVCAFDWLDVDAMPGNGDAAESREAPLFVADSVRVWARR